MAAVTALIRFKTRRDAEEYASSVRDKIARLERGNKELGRTADELFERYQRDALVRLNPIDRRARSCA